MVICKNQIICQIVFHKTFVITQAEFEEKNELAKKLQAMSNLVKRMALIGLQVALL